MKTKIAVFGLLFSAAAAIILFIAACSNSVTPCGNRQGEDGQGTRPAPPTNAPGMNEASVNASLYDCVVGEDYGPVTLAATGSPAPKFDAIKGLPPGLKQSGARNEIISGCPTTAGTFPFGVTARNAQGPFSISVSITVAEKHIPPAIHGDDPNDPVNSIAVSAIVGEELNRQLTSAGTGIITWNTADMLPAGLTLSPEGLISGIPNSTAGSPAAVNVTAASDHGTDSAVVTFTITSAPVAIDGPSSLDAKAVINTEISSINFTAAGSGTGPLGQTISWSYDALPAGLTAMDATISGTPTESGDFTITVTAEGYGGSTDSITVNMIVGIPPAITTTSFPKGTLTIAYPTSDSQAATIQATGYPTPVLTVTNLPDGLEWDSEAGVITGTPTGINSGIFAINVTASNSFGRDAETDIPMELLPRLGRVWSGIDNTKNAMGDYAIRDIAFGNNTFVAVGQSGRIVRSTTGEPGTWSLIPGGTTEGTSTFDGDIYGICYGDNMFIAVGSNGKMARSNADGSSWTAINAGTDGEADTSGFPEDAIIRSIDFGNGRWVAVGDGGRVVYSDDGITWTTVGTSRFGRFESIWNVTWGNGFFSVVGQGGTITRSEDNGVTWRLLSSKGPFSKMLTSGGRAGYGMVNGKPIFVLVGDDGEVAYSDDNARGWFRLNLGVTEHFRGICFGHNVFVATGFNDRFIWSYNGAKWDFVEAALGGTVPGMNGHASFGIAYGNGAFVAVGDRGQMSRSTLYP